MRSQLTKRYHKTESHLLYQFRQDAWKLHYAQQFPEAERAEVGERLAQHLEGMFPLADMLVLQKYGQAESKTQVGVSILNPETKKWDIDAGIELGRKVLVPAWRGRLYCGGPRFSEMPNRGLTEEGKRDVESGKYGDGWDAFCADQDKRDAEKVPKDLEPFFNRIVEERKLVKVEDKYRPERIDGKYPTWQEIAAQLPITGPYIIRTLTCAPRPHHQRRLRDGDKANW